MENEAFYTFLQDGVSFNSKEATKHRTIYMPLCGKDANSLKSAITPFLSGDIKVDKFAYLTKPVSTEDLRYDVRNFFVEVEGQGIFGINRETSPDSAEVEVGQLWHKLTREHTYVGLKMTALNFVPVNEDNVELMQIEVENISDKPLTITPTGCVPLFCRALANKHDHEHVTSLLNRIEQIKEGVVVTPTMSFDEEGHNANHNVYYVLGVDDKGKAPQGSFPTTENYCGEGGSLSAPQAILRHQRPSELSASELAGKEAVGALQFETYELLPKEKRSYLLYIGIAQDRKSVDKIYKKYKNPKAIEDELKAVTAFWEEKSTSLQLKTNDPLFNGWMRWVTIQPVLRRIYGCSFLPDHDYGKGGKGWRDIWQDLLSLILIEPHQVRGTLVHNFAGVRIDGSNATIIGSKPGEFIADRNVITRVWMDHGVWPFATILLYVHQSGDFDILLEETTYFKDLQASRTYQKDESWSPEKGNQLQTEKGDAYQGSILEHILIQHLVQFFNVGEHNLIRLENADWNDGLDMAFGRGESVAFSSFYAGNLLSIADLLEKVAEVKSIDHLSLAKEILILLDNVSGETCDYDDAEAKKKFLYEAYCDSVQPCISGEKQDVAIKDIAADLRKKGEWLFSHIRKNEKVSVKGSAWFNGYYDNKGKRVEGKHDNHVRMTLTGQVFPIMSGLADEEEIKEVVNSVNTHLKDSELGGFRLNSDFGVEHYLDLGRAFGFAFGTKENGAFFSHMAVMYAYALYSRGFAKEGFEVLNSIYQMSTDGQRANIYPGVPEYIDSLGRGMYHYLTGSASWYVLAVLTQAFGVRGTYGDLLIEPKLVKEQFDQNGQASIFFFFAGKRVHVQFTNANMQDYGQYTIQSATLNGKAVPQNEEGSLNVVIPRKDIESAKAEVSVEIVLV